jgi:hypothetical protein
VQAYDLNPPNRDISSLSKKRDADIKFVKLRVAGLLDDDFSFMKAQFGKCKNGSPHQKVPFAHTALVDVIWLACYSPTHRAERGIFDPMPLSLVVLAATAVYAALSCWKEGYYIGKKFTADSYAPIYRKLMITTTLFQDGPKKRCHALLASYTNAMVYILPALSSTCKLMAISAYSTQIQEPENVVGNTIKFCEAGDSSDDECNVE